MLKIKDDVDLKELERFGFKYTENKKLREKQKFNQAYALQELLQENKITDE